MAPKASKATRPRVYARLRPMFGRDAGGDPLFTIVDGTRLEYKKEEQAETSRYTFDRVFGMDSSQEEVYKNIGAVALESLRKGFNSTIVAYGQTGSGKTFSMEGAKDKATGQYTSQGLIPRIFQSVFSMFRDDNTIKDFEVSLQFIELYNEQLQDLLGKRKVVDVSADPTGGYQVKDATRHVCRDPEDAQAVYNKGCNMRATASTQMNESSSRSHALLVLSVNWVEDRGKSHAQLNLVDLAGSEGMKKTGAVGENAKEGIKINLSLTKLALTVKCLAEGAKHIPYRESKLTMMLAKGLGGNNMLHIILALSNSREQVAEGTACLRFGQSCLSMTVNPNANKLEKEQAEMKMVIKEQMQEISDLQNENEILKAELEEERKRKAAAAEGDIPDFMIAKHIEVNKEALTEDLNEAVEQIDELRRTLAQRQLEKEKLLSDDGMAELLLEKDESAEAIAAMEPQQRAEAMEARRRELMMKRMKAVAEKEQEEKAAESELDQLLEIKQKLEKRLGEADKNKAIDEERIRAELEEKLMEEKREAEAKRRTLEEQLLANEEENKRREEERVQREKALQSELERKDEMMRKEEALREEMTKASADQHDTLQAEMTRLQLERAAQDEEIERAKKAQDALLKLQAEAQAATAQSEAQAAELEKVREQLKQMEHDQKAREAGELAMQKEMVEGGASMYDSAETMVRKAEVRMSIQQRDKPKAEADKVNRILETLPVLSACNDLRALTDLEPANRTLFQVRGGIKRLIDYMRPKGQNAPYATIIARTLPCVMDKEGRRLFHEHAKGADMDNEVRYRYLLSLLQSSDPDDQENACLAIAAIAQDSEINRQACFDQGLSAQVLGVLQEQCKLPIPRQRLQRVVVMAMGELANGFEPYKELLRAHEGVPMLLSFLTPSHDEYLIKETLQLLGRMTQNSKGIQAELQRYSAIERYSQLLFAQLHDSQIQELAALALVNLCSEVPACLKVIATHPRYEVIRFELLASMARALSASMLRNDSTSMSLSGSDDFAFWGCAAVGTWEDGNAGGDRKHTSFVDNPQFLLRAPAGTNFTILLQDTLEASREQDKVKSRPLFLRLCVTSATPETVRTNMKQLDINASGSRPASVNDEVGVVMLEPNVQAALDISKTREVALRCHVKSAGPDERWVIVPHVGVSHQHSRYVLAIFADKPITLEGQLTSWNKRVVASSWTSLCAAPRGIANGLWRNCPQFQCLNVGGEAQPVHAFLSYAERDQARNKRHTLVVDPPGGMGAEERPLLSLYVMKSKVPDKRYVGTLSPYVEEYVAHSVVTNSWCVSAKFNLEPNEVYSILAVMAERPSHEVPLRLTLYSPAHQATDILLKPLTEQAEWYLTVLDGMTDEQGCTVVELLPQGSEAPGGGSKAAAGTTQAALVMEHTMTPEAFCSIVTEHEGVPHKMLPKYQQQQAVLSVPLSTGSFYSMTTRSINQMQVPLSGIPVKLLLYSTKPLQASPAAGQTLKGAKTLEKDLVCKATAEGVIYGSEAEPDDGKRQVGALEAAAQQHKDPMVLEHVITELEQQRDHLYEYTRAVHKDPSKPPLILDTLRAQNAELTAEKMAMEQQVRDARSNALSDKEALGQEKKAEEAKKLKEHQQQLELLRKDKAAVESQLKHANKTLEANREYIADLEVQMKTALSLVEDVGKRHAASNVAGAPDVADAEISSAEAKLEETRRLVIEEGKKLLEAQKETQKAKEEAIKVKHEAEGKMDAAKTAGAQADFAKAEGEAKAANDKIDELNKLLRQKSAANKELMRKMAENPKSSACVLQ